jgi:hypothetical protein
MINPPRSYAPIFGTADSATHWQWYGQMAHNSYAILNPASSVVSAQYRVYFGDAVTGSREAYAGYDDAVVTLTWTVDPVIVVKPARGGGLESNAPMIHVDLFYDYAGNEMRATLDTSYGVPKLQPLPAGYVFDSRSNYSVLGGKAYNFQYAWNPTAGWLPPSGAAVWIECLSASPGLETYDGPGNKMISPPRSYAPIFGTAGSATNWLWYGQMAHNSYAILNPSSSVVSARYCVFFGDAVTGSREAYADYQDTIVTLTWTVDPTPTSPLLRFGALDQTNAAPLCCLNAATYAPGSGAVVNLRQTNDGPCAPQYVGRLPMLVVPATAACGGPEPNHASLGSCVEFQIVSLAGPIGASLSAWEAGASTPRFSVPVGTRGGTNRLCVSESQGQPDCDPYGFNQGRLLTVSQPGLYLLGFRLVDRCTNGSGGGPIHAPSEVHFLQFQAGLTISSMTKQGPTVTASFAGEPGRNFYLERASTLGSGASWQTVAGPVLGFDRLQSLKDAAGSAGQSFYRLRTSVP